MSPRLVAKSKPPAANVTGRNRYQAPKMASNVSASGKQHISNIAGKGKQQASKMSVKFKEPVTVSKEETPLLKPASKYEHLSDHEKSSKESKKLGITFIF